VKAVLSVACLDDRAARSSVYIPIALKKEELAQRSIRRLVFLIDVGGGGVCAKSGECY
jgi:hypothetical protein